jgi:hypothetical protein
MRAWMLATCLAGGIRYRPFMVDGEAVPVCSAITIIYVQK